MDYNILWFILIGVLYTGFFVLEGFDFGVGMLLPFLGKKDIERRVIINTIGPHWDGNEVWLLTAGGATFAAFPHWYATLFSGFYLPLFLLLVALILRGVAFEFRSKDDNLTWRRTWDWAIFIGSLLPALLLPVAFANLVIGVPIDAKMQYTGGFFNLLNLYALLAGVSGIAVFLLHGALFLSLKTGGEVLERVKALLPKLWPVALALVGLLLIGTYVATDIIAQRGIILGLAPVLGVVALGLVGLFLYRQQYGWAFGMTSLTIAVALLSTFLILFPRVMVSSTDPANSLTIYTAASGPATLSLMTIVALIFVPIVLAYQAWSYWIFRQRLSGKKDKLTY
jgi:cytochrome d ubiquinol oxidase subunit II